MKCRVCAGRLQAIRTDLPSIGIRAEKIASSSEQKSCDRSDADPAGDRHRLRWHENLVKMPRMGEMSPIHCFFCHRSIFATHPQLSGIVVDAGDRFTLLLNPFGVRLTAFRETPLFQWFDTE